MSVDKKIRDALLGFGDPVENGIYTGRAERYYTFNYDTLGADYGDDAPLHERYLCQVHYFAPTAENVTARVRATKEALVKAGFTFPAVENADDADGRHRVFECETAEGVDYGEV